MHVIRTTMMMMMMMMLMMVDGGDVVPKLRLREQCFTQDICADVYAQCIHGVCACVAGSREQNDTCCKR